METCDILLWLLFPLSVFAFVDYFQYVNLIIGGGEMFPGWACKFFMSICVLG